MLKILSRSLQLLNTRVWGRSIRGTMFRMNDDLLGIYLNDHLAGSIVGLEVARRSLTSNRETRFESFLVQLVTELEQDRQVLEQVMDRLGVRRNPAKQAGAWLAEKAGRLKLNGKLVGYSELSRVLELEALTVGVAGKLSLWRNLIELAEGDERLSGVPLADVVSRSEGQRQALEANRLEAARLAFES
jgi:hypothetical protein